MNRIGIDFKAVGNHEVDEGKTELLRMQNGGNHPTDPYTEKAFPPTGRKVNFVAQTSSSWRPTWWIALPTPRSFQA